MPEANFHMLRERFQFLIGRLGTGAWKGREGPGLKTFQFLIGRLGTTNEKGKNNEGLVSIPYR